VRDTANALGCEVLPVDKEIGILMIRENINDVMVRREDERGSVSLKSQRKDIPRFIHLLCVFGIYLICIQL